MELNNEDWKIKKIKIGIKGNKKVKVKKIEKDEEIKRKMRMGEKVEKRMRIMLSRKIIKKKRNGD